MVSSSSAAAAALESLDTLEYTPTWVVAAVCTVIVVISLFAERFLYCIGKILKDKGQDPLFEALQKLKEELMLLGFISILLAAFQNTISQICIPASLASHMLPCKKDESTFPEHEVHHKKGVSLGLMWNRRGLLSEAASSNSCATQGKVPLLSLEGLHQLHMFIFVLAVVHVIFCATTMVLGRARIRQWNNWEVEIRKGTAKSENVNERLTDAYPEHEFVKERAVGFRRKSVAINWMMSFLKQFYASVSKSDYTALRSGFIMRHCSSNTRFDFHKYMMRTLEDDFKLIVGIRWYLWLFVIIFLLLNLNGWHTYFWLAFLPLILLLVVGTKLEHIITRLAQEAADKNAEDPETPRVKPSDHHFWFHQPGIVLYLIHFILFQNSFEIAFFIWIWSAYGFKSCIMEKIGYVIPRLVIGVIIQVLCSYSTLPLYAIVTQMGDMFKQAIFDEQLRTTLHDWVEDVRKRRRSEAGIISFLKVFGKKQRISGNGVQMQKMSSEDCADSHEAQQQAALEEIVTSAIDHSQVQT